jgi:hypothetical protein
MVMVAFGLAGAACIVARGQTPTWFGLADGGLVQPALASGSPPRFSLLQWQRGGDDVPPVLALVARVRLGNTIGGMATWGSNGWEVYPEIAGGVEMGRSTTFDLDGPHPQGPEPERIFAIRGGDGPSRVAMWTGSAWVHVGTLREPHGDAWGALGTFDADGDGPGRPVLIHANQRVSVWNGSGPWIDRGEVAGVGTNRVNTVVSFDPDADGPDGGPMTPRLVVAGQFTAIGGAAAQNLAAWDGVRWLPMPGLMSPGPVGQLAVHDFDGPLPGGPAPAELVAMTRTSLESQPLITTDAVAWNGTSWRRLADTTFDIPGDAAFPLNAASIGSGASARLLALGRFTTFAGVEVGRVAAYDEASRRFVPLSASNGAGFDSAFIDSIASVDLDADAGPLAPSLFASGVNLACDGVAIPDIARWNGDRWQPVTGAYTRTAGTPSVESISVVNDQSLVIGTFTGLNGVEGFNGLASFDGLHVSPMGQGIGAGTIGHGTVVRFDPDADGPNAGTLYASGSFVSAWDGSAWTRVLSAADGRSPTRTLAVHDFDGPGPGLPRLIVPVMSGTPLGGCVLEYDGVTWSRVRGGSGGGVGVSDASPRASALLSHDWDADGPRLPVLYTVTSATSAGGVAIQGTAFHDGVAWRAMGRGWTGTLPKNLVVFDTDGAGPRAAEIVAGGGIEGRSSGAAAGVCAWDGTAWRELGRFNDAVHEVAVFDPDGDPDGPRPPRLIACGAFTASNATALNRLASWNTTTQAWEPLSANQPAFNATVRALGVERPFGPRGPQRLAVGIGDRVLRFTHLGPAWCDPPALPADTTVAESAALTLTASVNPAYAGTTYRWLRDGTPAPRGDGLVGVFTRELTAATPVLAQASPDDSGVYTLEMTNAAGVSRSRGATVTVSGGDPVCPADFNRDGFIDFFDFADFTGCFEGLPGSCPADRHPDLAPDFNADGFVDFFDYLDFTAAFESGC